MANIELVIKIQEELYEAYKGRPPMLGDVGMNMIAQSIANGTPLPKGHGRLKDENEIKQMIEDAKVENESSKTFAENIIKFAPTIIEADKAGEDE